MPPIAISRVVGTRLWILPVTSASHRAGQRRDEVDGDGDDREEDVEQELVARLARVERVVEHALLGHEDVDAEQRAKEQRDAAGHVQERAR